jgi:glutathione S-transferase
MLHFFHHPQSPYSRKIFFLLEEAGHPYDLRTVSLEKKEQKDSSYLVLNPAGRVPAIKDGDFALSESNAILRYLTRKYQLHQFYPTAVEEQAQVDMWWDFCSNHINRPLIDLAWNKIMAPLYGGKPDAAVIAKAEKNLERDLPVLEKQLQGRNYLLTANLSLADINLMPFAVYAKDVIRLDDFPAFKAWINRVEERQAWKNVVSYSGH